MQNAADENWKVLLSLFPARWQQAARETGAVTRLRGFSSVEALLRTLMLHIARGYSLRETVVQARLSELADVSDVALMQRLRNSDEWLRTMCVDLFKENGALCVTKSAALRLRIVDGTMVKEPGPTGSQWRILYSLQLPSLECDFFDLTPAEGKGHGESYLRLKVQPGETVLGDAGYCTAAGIESVHRQGGYVLVRVNPAMLVVHFPAGQRISLLRRLRTLPEAGQVGEWPVVIREATEAISGRICAIRKSEQAIQAAHRRIELVAKRKNRKTKPETWEYAKYVVVFTTNASAPATEILQWYRLRWQIELVFKRLKTLAKLGHLPKEDERSARAWLYGKLLLGLLTQKLVRVGRDISPWGYALLAEATEPLA